MFALFIWQLGLCTRNDDVDNVEDDIDDDDDGDGVEDDFDDDGDGDEVREQQKECATGRD